MSKEYKEEVPLNGITIAQFQSRAVKAFASLGWKFENFSKIGVSATIPKTSLNPDGCGKIEISFMGTACEISCSLANPPVLAASRLAKGNVITFMKKWREESADPSADNSDEHEKFMTNALMAANRIENERLAAKEARANTCKRIKMILRCVIPLVFGVCGANSWGMEGFWGGLVLGIIVNEVLIFLWNICWLFPA